MMYWLLLFAVQLLVELLFVSYLYAIEARRPTFASSLGVCCFTLHAVAIVSFVADGWNLVPLGAGVFVGTWIVVARKKSQDGD